VSSSKAEWHHKDHDCRNLSGLVREAHMKTLGIHRISAPDGGAHGGDGRGTSPRGGDRGDSFWFKKRLLCQFLSTPYSLNLNNCQENTGKGKNL
jgi:hypothetical protein